MEYSEDENLSDGELVEDILESESLFDDESEENNEDQNYSGKDKEKPDESGKDSKEKLEKKIKQPRVVKNSRVTLSFNTLGGKNGLSALKDMFKNFKFKGNGHEKEDLVKILGILQHWMCYKLCPSYDFESCMLQLESLGKKKVVQTLMKKYRLGLDDWGENKLEGVDNAIAEANLDISGEVNKNEFDLLMYKEIANIGSNEELSQISQTQVEVYKSITKEAEITLTPEQLERIARNRKLAEERRLKRMALPSELEVNLQSEVIRKQEISSDRVNLEKNS